MPRQKATANTGRTCGKCGARVPANAPYGVCSACLLETGLGETFEEESLEPAESPQNVAESHLFNIPLRDFGDYELLEELGRGGQGVVHRARQKSLNRLVALKTVALGPWASEAHLKRFRLEAEAIAALDHPQIVPIYEIGQHDGCCFFTMKLIDGNRLNDVAGSKPMPLRRAAELLASLARTVHYAHQRGVLHRDIKPGNILIDKTGQAHLTDFGLAKLIEGECAVTKTMDVLGTPSYMPPEQASGHVRQLTVATDIYALGAVAYEMLTGQPPFTGATPAEILRQVEERDPRPPSQLNPGVDRDVETICLKCLEKDPQKRYSSALALAEDVDRFLRGEPIDARQIGSTERAWRWCRRNPVVALLGSGLLLSLLAVAVGSTIAAIRIQRAGQRAAGAEREAKQDLWRSYLEQATARRLSGTVGRRMESLRALAAAAQIKPSLELRNEAIASLALCDLGQTLLWRERDRESTRDKVIFDSNLERYAILRRRGGLEVFDARSGQVLEELPAPAQGGNLIARFSPDGKYLSEWFEGGRVIVWDLPQHSQLTRVSFPQTPPSCDCVSFSDSQLVAVAATNRSVSFYDLATGARSKTINTGVDPVILALSPTGKKLAVIADKSLGIWDVEEEKKLVALSHGAPMVSGAWHPAERLFAAGDSDGDIMLWDLTTGKGRILPGHSQWVASIAFDPAGDVFISRSWDGTGRFWDGLTGSPLFVTRQGLATQFSTDGNAVAFEREAKGFGIWQFIRSESFQVVSPPSLLSIHLMDLSADGRWLIFGDQAGWHLWSIAAKKETTFTSYPEPIWPIFSPAEDSVVGLTHGSIVKWKLEQMDGDSPRVGPTEVLASHPGAQFQHATFSQDGKFLTVAGHSRSMVLELAAPERAVEFSKGSSQSFALLNPDHQWLVACAFAGTGVTLWDAHTGRLLRQLVPNVNAQVALSPDGRTLITTTASEYCFWNTDDWQVRSRVPLDLGGATGGPVAFSHDCKLVALSPDRQIIKLLRAETGEELALLTPPELTQFGPIAFSGDGRYVAAMESRNRVYLWDLRALRRELAALNLDWSETGPAKAR